MTSGDGCVLGRCMSFSEGRGPELPRTAGAPGKPPLKDLPAGFWTGASVLQQNSPVWQRKTRFLIQVTSLGLALYFALAVDWKDLQARQSGRKPAPNVLSDFQDFFWSKVPNPFSVERLSPEEKERLRVALEERQKRKQ